jgi:sterol desaturase/sphingolipid hydroxylase (fatty acid hydroxylase superfamily)
VAWWFFGYWGLLGALAGVESLHPARSPSAKRQSRWPTNAMLGLTNALLIPLAPVSAVLTAEWARENGVGLFNIVPLPDWVSALGSLAGVSLASYAFHRVLHRVPLLWRLHRVHHMDTYLDVSTTLRAHPLEAILNVVTMAGVSMVLGPTPWVVVGYEIADQAVSAVSHANLRFPRWLDRPLRLLLVTPDVHCLHHSCYQPETDSNYGNVFTLWDRMFGTFVGQPAAGYDRLRIGLEEIRDSRVWDLWWQFVSPMVHLGPRQKGQPVQQASQSVGTSGFDSPANASD